MMERQADEETAWSAIKKQPQWVCVSSTYSSILLVFSGRYFMAVRSVQAYKVVNYTGKQNFKAECFLLMDFRFDAVDAFFPLGVKL